MTVDRRRGKVVLEQFGHASFVFDVRFSRFGHFPGAERAQRCVRARNRAKRVRGGMGVNSSSMKTHRNTQGLGWCAETWVWQTEKRKQATLSRLAMLSRAGAGTQHPIHFSCAPARSHTITTSNKANTTKQPPNTTPHHKRRPRGPERKGRGKRHIWGHRTSYTTAAMSPAPPESPLTTPEPCWHWAPHHQPSVPLFAPVPGLGGSRPSCTTDRFWSRALCGRALRRLRDPPEAPSPGSSATAVVLRHRRRRRSHRHRRRR